MYGIDGFVHEHRQHAIDDALRERRIFMRRRRHRALAIVIEPALRFPSEPAGLHEALLCVRRPIARIEEHAFEHRPRDGEIHIEADEVHEFERSHAEAADGAHRPVDRGAIGEAFFANAQRFAIERARHAIHQKPRRVGGEHRRLAPRRGERARLGDHRVRRSDRRNDLHERHDRRRIEEVHANDALRVRARAGQCRDGQRRRVRGQHGRRCHDGFERAKQLLLGGELLDDRLDHDAAGGEGRQLFQAHAIHVGDAGQHRIGLLAREPRFLDVAG